MELWLRGGGGRDRAGLRSVGIAPWRIEWNRAVAIEWGFDR